MAINYANIDQNKIKQDLYNYLKSSDNWNDINENIESSTLDMLLNVISAFGSYQNYKNQAWREENYIQEAKLESSIIRLARLLGYRINRFTAPSIKVKYLGKETLELNTGQKIGNINDYNVLYMGKARKIENGDDVIFHIGLMNKKVINISNQTYLSTIISPSQLKAIDNNKIFLYKNNEYIEISHNMEDFVIFSKVVDNSIDFYSTTLYIADTQNFYGINIKSGDEIKIQWLETNGKLNFKLQEVNLLDNFIPLSIEHHGSFGDDIEKIRFLAPLYYSTLRRMVTKNDHKYIISAHPYIKDCAVERDENNKFLVELMPQTPYNQTYTIDICGEHYETSNNETYADVINNIMKDINDNSKQFVSYIENNKLYIKQNIDEICQFSFNQSGFNVNVIEKYYKGKCCTLKCYYIKYDTKDNPKILTPTEQQELSKYIALYKMVGALILLIPANVEFYNLKIKISLNDYGYKEQVLNEINNIISSYELKLETNFEYGELISKIAQIKFNKNTKIIQPVDYVLPNQETFDLKAKIDTYYKFNVDIEIVE